MRTIGILSYQNWKETPFLNFDQYPLISYRNPTHLPTRLANVGVYNTAEKREEESFFRVCSCCSEFIIKTSNKVIHKLTSLPSFKS